MNRKRSIESTSSDLSNSSAAKRFKLEPDSSPSARYALQPKTNIDVKSEPIDRLPTPPRRFSNSFNSTPAPHRQLQQVSSSSSASMMPKLEPGHEGTAQDRMVALKQVTMLRGRLRSLEGQLDQVICSGRTDSDVQIMDILDQMERIKVNIKVQERLAYASPTLQGSSSSGGPSAQVPSFPAVKPEPINYSSVDPWGSATSSRSINPLNSIHGRPQNTSPLPSPGIASSPIVKSEPTQSIKWPAPRGPVYATPTVKREDVYGSQSLPGPSRLAPPTAYRRLSDVKPDIKPKVDPSELYAAHSAPPAQPRYSSDESDSEDAIRPNLGHGYPAMHHYGGQVYGQELTDFLLSAGNAETFEKDASVQASLEYLGLTDLNQKLPGMTIPLLAHQVLGVAWMVKKELEPRKSGGIMADEMGLGKTVQTIATMCINSPKAGRVKGTLIVAPIALLDQWQSEIQSKTDRNYKILIYHGSSKPKGQDAAKILATYDFVLTSYGTLSAEWPESEDFKARQKKKRRSSKKDDFIVVDSGDEQASKKKSKGKDLKIYSPLFETVWHRIVLDEAQNIRNRLTRVSIAVTDLLASSRWCLTGTPLTNGTADAYGLIRFLQIRPWYEWKEFNKHVVLREKKNPEVATNKLQLIFRDCLIRRKKDSMLDGRKLIELPPKEYFNPELALSQEESEIYTFLQARSRAIFNKFLRQGTVLKNYSQVLVLLLRLRQCCVHPALIAQYEDAFLQKGEIRENGEDAENVINELMRAEAIKGPLWVQDVRQRFLRDALERMGAEKEEGGDATANQECPICFDPMTDGYVIPCKHVYCKSCVSGLFEAPGQHQDGMNEDRRPCPECRAPFSKDHVFLQKVFMPTDAELGLEDAEAEEKTEKANRKGKSKGKARASQSIEISGTSDDDVHMADSDAESDFVASSRQKSESALRRSKRPSAKVDYAVDSDDSMDDFIVEDGESETEKDVKREAKLKSKRGKGKGKMRVDSDDEFDGSRAEEDEEEEEIVEVKKGDYLAKVGIAEPVRQPPMMAKFLPSTKMIAMMDLLENIRDNYPDDKVMVVSQWTSALELCANYLDEKHFGYVRYEGNMNRTAREHSVRAFMDTAPENVRVMLMSLKAGGVGLNLVRANWVISLDFAWSEAVEAQAFDRTHRLGQTKRVQIHRLCIANSVEGRVKALQAQKKQLADGSLGEGGAKLGRLSVRELAGLFGLDMRGNIIN
ncbi:hypothetical protein FRB90_008804 [Tulasnella sp. 427]|nr:hypothetical protein FRB90_008804 [Tulasnella sp. 427]